MSYLRTFVLYSETTGNIIPMSLMRRKSPPSGRGVRFLEIPDGCCTPIGPIEGSQRLKAYVKMSSSGKILSGPLVRTNKPSGSGFKQIPYNICCQTLLSPIEVASPTQDITMDEGDVIILNPNITKSSGTITYTWSQDGTTLPDTGMTLAITPSVDTVYIQTITNALGSVTVTYNITVVPPGAESINVTPATATILVGGTTQLTATVSPALANQSKSWVSSAPTIASVSATGLVTGILAGSSTITATSTDGGFTDTSVITVTGE